MGSRSSQAPVCRLIPADSILPFQINPDFFLLSCFPQTCLRSRRSSIVLLEPREPRFRAGDVGFGRAAEGEQLTLAAKVQLRRVEFGLVISLFCRLGRGRRLGQCRSRGIYL